MNRHLLLPPLRATVVALLVTATILAGAGPAWSEGDTAVEQQVLQLLQQSRQQAGLSALQPAADLRDVARRHSRRMADEHRLFHSPDLGGQLSGWTVLGENVGRSASGRAVHELWLRSPGHRANLLRPDYDEVGIGVERRGDLVWITQVFRRNSTRPAAPAAAPVPASAPPAPAPAPVTAAAQPTDTPAPPPAAEPTRLVDDRLARALAASLAREGGPPPSTILLGSRETVRPAAVSSSHDARG